MPPTREPFSVVFGGPSLPRLRDDRFAWHPPAVRGDFRRLPRGATVVYIDSYMWQRATVTHRELLEFLNTGGTIIGAASAGALRAVELRAFGLIGIGSIYAALLQGLVIDDGELLAAVHPDTGRAMTVPLVDVRHMLALTREHVPPRQLSRMLRIARNIYFMERTPHRLLADWAAAGVPLWTSLAAAVRPLTWPSIKELDSTRALAVAREGLSPRGRRPRRFDVDPEREMFFDP